MQKWVYNTHFVPSLKTSIPPTHIISNINFFQKEDNPPNDSELEWGRIRVSSVFLDDVDSDNEDRSEVFTVEHNVSKIKIIFYFIFIFKYKTWQIYFNFFYFIVGSRSTRPSQQMWQYKKYQDHSSTKTKTRYESHILPTQKITIKYISTIL